MIIRILDEVDSTNAYLMREASSLEAPLLLMAESQTAGRGQKGNSWEAAPGKNMTFSVLVRPHDFKAVDQFAISEATALAVVDFLALHGIEAMVKWPNDIYVEDRKICGILIQHSIMGGNLAYSVLGVGINVNQERFLSDAPNPVSMWQITGIEYPLEDLACQVGECIEQRLGNAWTRLGRESQHLEFKSSLWRGDGACHPFIDASTGESFHAAISDISPQGPVILRLPDGTLRTYSFKEVSFSLCSFLLKNLLL